jgi:hypothetical protein
MIGLRSQQSRSRINVYPPTRAVQDGIQIIASILNVIFLIFGHYSDPRCYCAQPHKQETFGKTKRLAIIRFTRSICTRASSFISNLNPECATAKSSKSTEKDCNVSSTTEEAAH